MKLIEVVGSTESNEVIEGEVIGDGDDEKMRGKRIGVWERGLRSGSEEVENASAFAEFRVLRLGS